MAEKRYDFYMEKKEEKSGFLLVNKSASWTSFDVVAKLRSITGIKKIGHSGTLDPFATGLLIVAIGRSATKQLRDFVKKDKTYETTLLLGSKSSTHDPEGKIEKTSDQDLQIPKLADLEQVVQSFVGEQEQIPPMHSAKKVAGKKLYQLARQGKEIERWPETIEIFDLQILDYSWPSLVLRVHCSSGTYIRVLGSDVGKALGTDAYLTELKRTAIGEYRLESAQNLADITEDNWQDFCV